MRAREFTEPQAAGCIIKAADTGRWCLQQRSNSVSDPGVWSTWGGGREPGETLEQTVRRELAEEGGYTGPLRLEPLMMNQRYATYIGHVPHEFEPRLNSESQDSCWVEAGDWPSPMHPGLDSALTHIDEGLKSKLAGAALAGGMALGAGGANAMDWKDAAMTGAMFVPGIGQVAKAYNVGSSLWDAAKAAKQYKDLGKDIDAIAAKQAAQPKQSTTVAYDPDNADKFEPIDEAFDQPYSMTWEHGDESHDALVRLPDGTNLSIMFSKDYGNYGDEEWTVEFWRNNSQEATGEGDQQRIFATVLSAIQQFIDTEHPERIRFSANKDVEPGQKSQTRSNLYTKLVQRYANSWGYGVDVDDFADTTVYNLHTLNENFADGRNPQDKGDSKRYGVPTKASVSTLRKVAKQGGRKGQLAHWMANMKAGRAKARKK